MRDRAQTEYSHVCVRACAGRVDFLTSALRRRAAAAGIAEDTIDRALDDGTPNEALRELIMRFTQAAAAGMPAVGRPARSSAIATVN